MPLSTWDFGKVNGLLSCQLPLDSSIIKQLYNKQQQPLNISSSSKMLEVHRLHQGRSQLPQVQVLRRLT
jgi:hypothetical protein